MKIKFGALVVDGSGKIGGHVVASNRGGKYMRTKTTPLNPQTSAQSAVRLIFASISSSWSGLTQADRTSFNQAVANFGTTDIFGDLRNPSGKALFQRLNQNLALSGQPQLSVAPSVLPVDSGILQSVVFDVSNEEMLVSTLGGSSLSYIVIEATPPLSQGTENANNKFRVIATSVGGEDFSDDFWLEYVAKFGLPAVGANIQVRVKFVNAIGLTSPYQKVKATVQV